jgi:hypothetical protein
MEMHVEQALPGDRIAFPVLIDSYVYPEPPPIMRTVKHVVVASKNEIVIEFEDGHTQSYKPLQTVWIERPQ